MATYKQACQKMTGRGDKPFSECNPRLKAEKLALTLGAAGGPAELMAQLAELFERHPGWFDTFLAACTPDVVARLDAKLAKMPAAGAAEGSRS